MNLDIYTLTRVVELTVGLSKHNGELQRKRNGAEGRFGEEWAL